jgi:single-stranded-DNA-specific exonuclease
MDQANWESLLERLRLASRTIELNAVEGEERIAVDAELPPSYLTPDILKIVDRFEPYGEENNPLIFMSKGLRVADLSFMGKTEAKHVKLTLDAGKHKWPAVYWQAAERVKRDFDLEDRVDLVFTLNRNWFNGIETPQLIITDLRRTEAQTAV